MTDDTQSISNQIFSTLWSNGMCKVNRIQKVLESRKNINEYSAKVTNRLNDYLQKLEEKCESILNEKWKSFEEKAGIQNTNENSSLNLFHNHFNKKKKTLKERFFEYKDNNVCVKKSSGKYKSQLITTLEKRKLTNN